MMNVEEANEPDAVRLFNPDDKIFKRESRKIVELAQHAPLPADSQLSCTLQTGNTPAIKKRHAETLRTVLKQTRLANHYREDWAKFPRENMLKHNEAIRSFSRKSRELSDMTRQDLQ